MTPWPSPAVTQRCQHPLTHRDLEALLGGKEAGKVGGKGAALASMLVLHCVCCNAHVRGGEQADCMAFSL